MLGWRCAFDNDPLPCASPEQARDAGLQLCFLQHGIRFKVQHSTLPYRFIHAIRDPMEVVLSGYQYHLKTTERWANRPERRYNGTTYRKYLNALSLHDGLRAEVKHSLRDSLKTMPRLLNHCFQVHISVPLPLSAGKGLTWDVTALTFESLPPGIALYGGSGGASEPRSYPHPTCLLVQM